MTKNGEIELKFKKLQNLFLNFEVSYSQDGAKKTSKNIFTGVQLRVQGLYIFKKPASLLHLLEIRLKLKNYMVQKTKAQIFMVQKQNKPAHSPN